MVAKPLVTILIPNYKTLELTKLCLRLIRKYTQPEEARVIVIDNDSQDDSTAYLRTLNWITLLERPAIPNEGAISSHSRALDLGLSHTETPYVLSIHTDTLIKSPDWLAFLVAQLKNPQVAAVGSWKLETKSWWRMQLKKVERFFQLQYIALTGKEDHHLAGVGKNYYYLRSHCALYRTDLLRKHNLLFSDGDGLAGKVIHQQLQAAGYQLSFLPSDVLSQYLEHVNHATTVLNPELSTRAKSVSKGRKRIEKCLARFNANVILQDRSLDF